MNAKEQIEAIKGMEALEDVKAVLAAENASEKPRKTVIDACEERIGEIETASAGIGENPEAGAPEAGAPVQPEKAKKRGSKIAEAPKREQKTEEQRIAEFKSKTNQGIQCASIEKFAHEFFGDKLKSVSIENYMVTITLKSKTKFTQRGV